MMLFSVLTILVTDQQQVHALQSSLSTTTIRTKRSKQQQQQQLSVVLLNAKEEEEDPGYKRGYQFGDISKGLMKRFGNSVNNLTGKEEYEFGGKFLFRTRLAAKFNTTRFLRPLYNVTI